MQKFVVSLKFIAFWRWIFNFRFQIFVFALAALAQLSQSETAPLVEFQVPVPYVIEASSNQTAVPYAEVQCDDSCCFENLPQVFITRDDPCCNLSKLVIPFHLTALAKVPTNEITDISKESDPVVKILKLLRLIEKCRK